MPVEWAPRIVIQIFKDICDIMNNSCYGTMKRLEYCMPVAEKAFEKRFRGPMGAMETHFCLFRKD